MFSGSAKEAAKVNNISLTIEGIYTCVILSGVEFNHGVAKAMTFGEYTTCKSLEDIERTFAQAASDVEKAKPAHQKCTYILTINLKVYGSLNGKSIKTQYKSLDELRHFLEDNGLLQKVGSALGMSH